MALTGGRIMKFVIKNCLCYTTENKLLNCLAEPLGYRCEDNQGCPIRITYCENINDNFEIEEVEE